MNIENFVKTLNDEYGTGYTMPNVPKDAPEGLKKMLNATYSNIRQKWTEAHPDDKENEDNKSSAASIAWEQVKKYYKKDKDGKWIAKENKDIHDSNYCHEVLIRNLNDFEGGTFHEESIQGVAGVYCTKGRLAETGIEDIQSMEFSKSQFTPEQVKKYLDDNKINYLKLTVAKDDGETIISVNHIDILDETQKNLSKKMVVNSDGSIEGKPIVTNIGVFQYRQKDGTVIRELRPPEEVFDENSLNTLKNISITNSHPDLTKYETGLVDETNKHELEVGKTKEDVEHDHYAVSVGVKITEKNAIQEVKNGKRDMSCGYKADLDFTPGNFLGMPYDAVQRKIRYNHIATVPRARAGDLAKMIFDSDDNCSIYDEFDLASEGDKYKGGSDMPLKKVKIDGVEYDAEAKVIEAYTLASDNAKTLQVKVDEMTVNNSKVQGERDALKAELDKVKKDSVMSDEQIQSLVNERMNVLSIANELKITVKKDEKDMSNLEIKKEVIKKKIPAVKLDGKDEVYIDAMYDTIVLTMKEEPAKNNKTKVFDVPGKTKNDSSEPVKSAAELRRDAYQRQIEELENRHTKPKEQVKE